MYLALKFTFEKKENKLLSFLDVLVQKSYEGFLTSGFRKPILLNSTFVGIRLEPTKRKTNLIETLI